MTPYLGLFLTRMSELTGLSDYNFVNAIQTLGSATAITTGNADFHMAVSRLADRTGMSGKMVIKGISDILGNTSATLPPGLVTSGTAAKHHQTALVSRVRDLAGLSEAGFTAIVQAIKNSQVPPDLQP